MADAQQAFAAAAVASYDQMLLGNYCSVAATILVFYDYAITFDRELECIWGRQLGVPTILFALNRYVTMIYRVFMTLAMVPWTSNANANSICTGILRFSEVLTVIMQLVVTLFTSLRIFAIWEKKIAIFALIFCLGLISPAMEFWYYTRLTFVAAPPPFMGCATFVNVTLKAGRIFAHLSTVVNMVVDCAILVVTWLKTGSIRKYSQDIRSQGFLSTVLLRDGTVYFFALLLLNILDLVAIQYQALGAVPALTQVVTAVLISRFFFNLREIYSDGYAGDSTYPSSSVFSHVRFVSSIIGNLGAPLGDYDSESKTLVDAIELDTHDIEETGVSPPQEGGWAIGSYLKRDGVESIKDYDC